MAKCAHCGAESFSERAELNVEFYGGPKIARCGKCGKASYLDRVVVAVAKYDGDREEDDFGERIRK